MQIHFYLVLLLGFTVLDTLDYLVLPYLTHLICIDFALQELVAGTESMKTQLDQLEQSAPEVSQSRPVSESSDLSQGL